MGEKGYFVGEDSLFRRNEGRSKVAGSRFKVEQ